MFEVGREEKNEDKNMKKHLWKVILWSFALLSMLLMLGGCGGEEKSQMEIYTVEDLKNVSSNLSGSYILMNDIDLGGIEWTPFGTFNGLFDGNGYVISNFKITGDRPGVGLFGCNDGTIQNLGVESFTIDVNCSVFSAVAGGLAGVNIKTITNCYAKGDVIGGCTSLSASYTINAGGLVGSNSGKIVSCYAMGTVSSINESFGSTSTYANAGGLAGSNYGTITESYATGVVSSSGASPDGPDGFIQSRSFAGGLVGSNGGNIANCYATGNTSGSNTSLDDSCEAFAGGLVGSNDGNIENCYATGDTDCTCTGYWAYGGGLAGENLGTVVNSYSAGDVSSSDCAGGLVGSNGGNIANCYEIGNVSSRRFDDRALAGGLVGDNYGAITNSYGVGNVSSIGAYRAFAGGLVGHNRGTCTPITNCYRYSGQSIMLTKNGKTTYSATNTDGTAISIENLQFKTWVEENLWKAEIEIWNFGAGYPTLNYEAIEDVKRSIVEISAKEDLLKLQAGGLLGNYKLMADIDLGGIDWQPIALLLNSFDGNGHVISNFKVSGDVQYAGLFGFNEGTIKNLGSEGFAIDVSHSDSVYVGGLVGENNGTIMNCYAKGSISGRTLGTAGTAYIGGLVGSNGGGPIKNCYTTADVNSSHCAGGLVGHNSNGGSIHNCYATGAVSGFKEVGGFVGVDWGSIMSCYRYSGQKLNREDNTQGMSKDMSTLQSVDFQQNILGWSAGDWNFAEGTHPKLKPAK